MQEFETELKSAASEEEDEKNTMEAKEDKGEGAAGEPQRE